MLSLPSSLGDLDSNYDGGCPCSSGILWGFRFATHCWRSGRVAGELDIEIEAEGPDEHNGRLSGDSLADAGEAVAYLLFLLRSSTYSSLPVTISYVSQVGGDEETVYYEERLG